MTEQLAYDRVTTPDGRVFKVSTVRTLAGGADNNKPHGSPFSDADYLSETPWPFETMVFKDVGASGQFHSPTASKKAALAEHARVIQLIKDGAPFEGIGVTGMFGNPSTTATDWFAKVKTEQEAAS